MKTPRSRRSLWFVTIGAVLLLASPVNAQIAGQCNWKLIADGGNAADPLSGFGAVVDDYRIQGCEVTNKQYALFLNAVAATDTGFVFTGGSDTLYDVLMDPAGDIFRSGVAGSYVYTVPSLREEYPVQYVTFWDAVRYVNWISNCRPTGPETPNTTLNGSYDLTDRTVATLYALTRNPGARLFLPSADEWYKAGYYDAGTTSYKTYPLQTPSTT
jgi:hypothetical protein